jgi:predicted RNA binding protein YcfA (HicA-like mRNA interferase family)
VKRRDLVRVLLDLGAVLVREGAEHTVYVNPRTGVLLPVPRHREISEGVTRSLLKDARA